MLLILSSSFLFGDTMAFLCNTQKVSLMIISVNDCLSLNTIIWTVFESFNVHFQILEYQSVQNFENLLYFFLQSSTGDSAGMDNRSISSISNEESWETIQFEDAQATRWVPDHLSNICATCDSQFNLVVRKHHCR